MLLKLTRLSAALSVLLLLLAAGLYFAGIKAEKGSGSPGNLVQARVWQQLQAAKTDAGIIEENFRSGNLFRRDLLRKISTATFLYRKKKLLFWSDHYIQPDPELIRQQALTRAVEMRTGKFLVKNLPLDSQFVLVQYIPLERTYPVRNAFFASGLNDDIFKGITATILLDKPLSGPVIKTEEGSYLFSLSGVSHSGTSPLITAAVLCLLGAFLAFVFWIQVISFRFYKRKWIWQGLLVGLLPVLLLRAGAIIYNFPFAFADLGFFNPRVFAASVWSQSVGDLLLTLLVAGLIALHIWYLSAVYFRKLAANAKKVPSAAKIILLLGLYLGSVYVLYDLYESVLANSRVELDITQSLKFTMNRAGLMAACILFTGTYFLVSQSLMRALMPVFGKLPVKFPAGIFVSFGLVALGFFLAGYYEGAIVLAAGMCYPFVSYLLLKTKETDQQTYSLYVRLFVAAAISAVIGATSFYKHQKQRDSHQKEQIAETLLLKNDPLSEYLLHEAGQKIASDPLIKRQLLNPVASTELIRQKIVRQYVGNQFNAYDTRVHIYGVTGFLLSSRDSVNTLAKYNASIAKGTEKAGYPGLFLKTGQGHRQSRTYIQFINLSEDSARVATIVLELSLKRMPSQSVVPQLLVDQRFSQAKLEEGYSYAIYRDGELKATAGDFDYRAFLGEKIPSEARFPHHNFTAAGFTHYRYAGSGPDEIVVFVSSVAYLLENSLANFSFLMLLFTGSILSGLVFYALLRPGPKLRLWASLSTKIQLLLSLGLLVPLVVISLAIIGQITKSYQADVRASYHNKGDIINSRLSTYVQHDTILPAGEPMRDILGDLAQMSEAEIHLYDNNGRLLLASQPLLFETGLISSFINPMAYTQMAFAGRQRLLLPETAGRWSFNVLYMPVFSGSDKIAGFVALPFYDSDTQLDTRVNKLVTTVMSIFTLIFLIAGLLTFVASQAVVKPLQLVTDKIRRVTLSKRNEPIYYAANDELGLLVAEYNEMLRKLEESKRELAEKEKEQAWREMARQVAHEIKNPLTPMKLSMQYLQHALKSGQGNLQELIERTANTIITQVNVLSDIATSFSHFTSLPEPQKKLVDLNSVIRQTADLHNDPGLNSVQAVLPGQPVFVLGDEDLLVRIFNNLVLNALQAIPAGTVPKIVLKLTLNDKKKQVLAEVQDNGAGIPEELLEKVFVPNFSTKYAGSGIGLAVAKKGIEQMGGTIWFTTALNKGTTFYIQMPLAG